MIPRMKTEIRIPRVFLIMRIDGEVDVIFVVFVFAFIVGCLRLRGHTSVLLSSWIVSIASHETEL